MYLQVVKELFKANKLVRGELEIMGAKVNLAEIRQPVYLVAGQKDDITPPLQLFSIKHFISSSLIEEHSVNAGHIGVFMGSAVISDFWAGHFQKLCRAPFALPAYAATTGAHPESAQIYS
jgi:poly(3-hydroxyalkanoate) synthetase